MSMRLEERKPETTVVGLRLRADELKVLDVIAEKKFSGNRSEALRSLLYLSASKKKLKK